MFSYHGIRKKICAHKRFFENFGFTALESATVIIFGFHNFKEVRSISYLQQDKRDFETCKQFWKSGLWVTEMKNYFSSKERHTINLNFDKNQQIWTKYFVSPDAEISGLFPNLQFFEKFCFEKLNKMKTKYTKLFVWRAKCSF